MLTVGIVMGGVSPEHEVSVISSLQAAHALDREQYRPVPIYIAKDGAWFTGEVLMDTAAYQDLDALREQATPVWLDGSRYRQLMLRPAHTSRWTALPTPIALDVLLLGLHGGPGEDGSLQGLCEVFNVPYTGSGVFGSALGMDKVQSKMICRDQDIPVVDFVAFRESDWGGDEETWMDRIEERLGYPVIVKPARLGSSIGIAKADDRAELDHAIEDAFRYDEKIVIEEAVQHLREINCSVLGDPQEAIASVLEQPVPTDTEEVLSFTDKYQRGGSGNKARGLKQPSDRGMASLDRLIPAPLSEEQTAFIRDLGVRIFQTFECSGVARIDFMINDATGQVYFNEINTIPGSFSFYLWEPTGIPFADLMHRLVQTALRRHEAKNGRVRTYDTNLLSERSLGGLKGKG